jgi:hypothetical protein
VLGRLLGVKYSEVPRVGMKIHKMLEELVGQLQSFED